MSTGAHYSERTVTLPGRGDIFVRESEGPPDAPVFFLLHGLGATGLLNWRSTFEALAERLPELELAAARLYG